MKTAAFTPKLFSLLAEGISKQQLGKDIMSGVVVSIVALPLAIAFSIASGVSPEKGLITAVVAGLIISVFGGSRVQVGGPTGAFIVIVAGIVQEHGVNGLIIATFMAGFIIIAFGLLRFGNYLKFVPYPLIVGFTSGIAVIIFSSQVKDFLGLSTEQVPVDFIGQWTVYGQHWQTVNYIAVVIALLTVVLIFGMTRLTDKVPGSIIAIVLSTAVVYYFELPVETIESRFGAIPAGLGMPQMPNISLELIKQLFPAALAIALLGSIESLLSAVVADGMIGGKHRSNMELVAQGSANVFSGLFAGMPATGAIARTATNVKNGGRTPISGIVHALVLLLVVLLFAHIAQLIPLSCLAGILVVVAWHMGEWKQFISLFKSGRLDIMILLSTFLITVFYDLILAIEVGMVLSSFAFMKKMSDTVQIEKRKLKEKSTSTTTDEEILFEEELPAFSDDILLYEINGPLFFGASHRFREILLGSLFQLPKVLILRMREVPFIDATGINTLRMICQEMQEQESVLIIAEANEKVLQRLKRAKLNHLINPKHIYPSIEQALQAAEKMV